MYHEIQVGVYATGIDQALLDYIVFKCSLTTFDCVPVEGGFGLTSRNELSVTRDRITINTTTAGNPAFELWEGSGGPITLTWTQLSGWSHRSSMQTRYRDADGSSHSHGTFNTAPALAEGTVLGVRLDPGSGFAQMGTVKEGVVSISR